MRKKENKEKKRGKICRRKEDKEEEKKNRMKRKKNMEKYLYFPFPIQRLLTTIKLFVWW